MLRRHWQGMYRCTKCWEPRQPQDFVRAIPDIQTPPVVQPEPADIFVALSEGITTEVGSDIYGNFDYILTELSEIINTES